MQLRLLKGRSFPGKVLITRRMDPQDDSVLRSPDSNRSFSDNDTGSTEQTDEFVQVLWLASPVVVT